MPTPRTMLAVARPLAAGVVLLAIAGCGHGGAAGAAAVGGWKATDACAVIDKATVAATLGGTITSAKLGAVKDQGGGLPLYSQCSFLLGDGRMLVFGTGQSTDGETLDHQVADMRRQARMISDSSPVDVPGLGKAALWAPDVHALYVFLGDGRFVSATLAQIDFRRKQAPIETVKAQEIAILRKAGA